MISTRGRYAIRVMTDLAENEGKAYLPLKDIAARQDISKKYLEIIMKDLVGAGLVTAASGRGGGYQLSKDPGQISALDILEATEGSLATVACLKEDSESCPRESVCKTLPLWKDMDDLIRGFLGSRTLLEIVNEERICLKTE